MKHYFSHNIVPEEQSYKEIFQSWVLLQECRNKIAHGKLIFSKDVSPEEAFWLAVNLPRLLTWMLNKINIAGAGQK